VENYGRAFDIKIGGKHNSLKGEKQNSHEELGK
jgi:hypothetical protein